MIANATVISSLSIAALLSISFVVMLRRQILPTGYRGIMISALTVLAVLVVNILIFSGLGTQIGMSSSLSTRREDDRKCHRDLFAFHRCAPFYFFCGDVKKTNSSHRIQRNNDICINSIGGFGG